MKSSETYLCDTKSKASLVLRTLCCLLLIASLTLAFPFSLAFAEDEDQVPDLPYTLAEKNPELYSPSIIGPDSDVANVGSYKQDPSYINAVQGGIFAQIGLFDMYSEEPRETREQRDYSNRAYTVYSKEEVQAASNPFYLFSNSSVKSDPDVYIIVAAQMGWSDITQANTPVFYDFVGNNASANLIHNGYMYWYLCDEYKNLHYLIMPYGGAAEVEHVLKDTLPQIESNDSVIVTSAPCFLDEDPEDLAYSMFVMKDTSDTGLLTSSTTCRRGLITALDAVGAVTALLDSPQRYPGSLSVSTFTNAYSADVRLDRLHHDAVVSQAMQASQMDFVKVFVIALVAALVCSMILLSLEVKASSKFLANLLPILRVLWIITLAIPLASYVMFVHLPAVADTSVMLDYCWFYTLLIAFVCIVVSLVAHWTWAYVSILVATVSVLVIDQLLGGPLSAGGYLSYAPLEHVRYYGLGNEGAALLFGAWLSFSGLLLTRRSQVKQVERFRKWGFLLLSAIILAVIAAPWWGANFGGLVWGPVGIFLCWRMFNGNAIRKKDLLYSLICAGLLALCVLVLDTSLNGDSHMGDQFDFSQGDWLGQIATIFGNVFQMSYDTLVFSPPLTVAFFIIMALLYILYFKHPGSYRAFWSNNKDFLSCSQALFITAFIMLIVEDSGILMPALLLLYPISGLAWLICDYHSWHIRDFLHQYTKIKISKESGHADEI